MVLVQMAFDAMSNRGVHMSQTLSVSSPKRSPRLALEAMAEAPRPMRPGWAGTASQETSRSQRAYAVHGKATPRSGFSSGPGVRLESVIGTDERKRILDTDLLPWRMICALQIRGQNGAGLIGTGWLAGPSTIVTAGHCVHHEQMGGWATEIEVSCGRNGQEFPFPSVRATNFSAHARWVSDHDPDYDVACIHLDPPASGQPLGEQVGWFAIAALSADDLKSHLVNISGYPADLADGTEQYFHANRVLQITDRRIFYDVDTYGGQSGAPVWIHQHPGDPPTVVAVHAYGVSGAVQANSAPRIDQQIFDLIQTWITKGHVPTS